MTATEETRPVVERLTALQVRYGGRRLGTDCGSCGRTELGIIKPMRGGFALVKLSRHQRPAGAGWCVESGREVTLDELRPIGGTPAQRHRHHEQQRAARQ